MTSKEQAHVLAKEAAFAISNNTLQQYHNEPMVQHAIDMNAFTIAQTIPLTELLEVAKAAQIEATYQPDQKGERFGYWISENEFEKLEDAIFALRATGKVKL